MELCSELISDQRGNYSSVATFSPEQRHPGRPSAEVTKLCLWSVWVKYSRYNGQACKCILLVLVVHVLLDDMVLLVGVSLFCFFRAPWMVRNLDLFYDKYVSDRPRNLGKVHRSTSGGFYRVL